MVGEDGRMTDEREGRWLPQSDKTPRRVGLLAGSVRIIVYSSGKGEGIWRPIYHCEYRPKRLTAGPRLRSVPAFCRFATRSWSDGWVYARKSGIVFKYKQLVWHCKLLDKVIMYVSAQNPWESWPGGWDWSKSSYPASKRSFTVSASFNKDRGHIGRLLISMRDGKRRVARNIRYLDLLEKLCSWTPKYARGGNVWGAKEV